MEGGGEAGGAEAEEHELEWGTCAPHFIGRRLGDVK